MRVGIVMPAFNVAPFIGEAVRSVLRQTWPDWVMTIVDDGSSDATSEIAASFHDPRIRLIRQSNAGVSAARNRGLDAIDADAILFLDADDWLNGDALRVLVAALLAECDAVAVAGAWRKASAAGVPMGPTHLPPVGDVLETLLVRNLFANGGHILIRREALDAAGRFDRGLRYGEDWEFWTRLACRGRFAAVSSREPRLFVRERPDGAYGKMAARPESFVACVEAIYAAPALRERFGARALARLRQRADAENDWIVGRELIRHGRRSEGRAFLFRSARAAPSARRLALLAASLSLFALLPTFRRYPTTGPG